MRDYVNVMEDGKKVKMQKRYFKVTLMELYELFITENPDRSIGKSKFCDLRPENVLTYGDVPNNMCASVTHQNFTLKLIAMHKTFKEITEYSYSFMKDFTS